MGYQLDKYWIKKNLEAKYHYRHARLIFKPNNKFQTFEIRNGCTSNQLMISRIDATVGSTKSEIGWTREI